MSKKSLIWKIPCIVLGVVMGIVLLLLITVTVIMVTPKARTAVLQKCVEVVNDRTDRDVDLGRLYLSPFHHSPMILYRAYKGKEDLPLHIEIDKPLCRSSRSGHADLRACHASAWQCAES